MKALTGVRIATVLITSHLLCSEVFSQDSQGEFQPTDGYANCQYAFGVKIEVDEEDDAGRERGAIDVDAPVIELRPLPEDGRLSVFRPHLAKYVEVFGLHVVATESSSDAKVLHAATILAEWLDNDEDGVPR